MPVPRGPIRLDFLGEPPPQPSLAEPSFPPERDRVYRKVLDVLDDHGLPYLVGGALAVNAHTGVWRDTKDLDLFMPHARVDDALDAFEAAGLGVEVVYPEWLSRTYDGDVFVDILHRNANGLVPVGEEWLERAVPFEILGRRAPVLGIEDLVWSKIYVFSRNRCDIADIHHVLFLHGHRMDWDLLLRNAGDEAAGLLLAHLHLFRWTYPEAAAVVPDDVLARLERDARRDRGSFRGTLLDTVSYRVDVDAWGLPDTQRRVVERVLSHVTPGDDKAS